MGAQNAPRLGIGPSVFPTLTYVSGSEHRTFNLDHTPFSIGRKMDKDLVIPDPRVSRDQALLVSDNGRFFLEDQRSTHGTFVNGKKIDRVELEPNDRIEFGSCDTVYAIFYPQRADTSTARDFLTRIPQINISNESTDLEKVTIFLEAARKLNTSGVLDEILVALLDMTLKLTGAERGYVFLKNETGDLKLAAGRNSRGELLLDDTTVSHSIIQDALRANCEFLISDTRRSDDLAARQSIVAFDLRTVICIPLRKLKVTTRGRGGDDSSPTDTAIGVLYVDSRFSSRDISKVSAGILHGVATEAASLIENARLVQAEEASRRYQQELVLAASIQQRLMAVTLPEVPFARLEGKNIPCNEIGGDFFDGVRTPDGLAMVLADVAGKGVSAALLASTLQGMIYSQLLTGASLREIVTSANRFLTSKHIGEKFATVIIALLHPDGELEYVNCGHIPPLLIRENNKEVVRLTNGNLPIGVLENAVYESDREGLRCGDRLVLVTDGVTEAANPEGDFFDEDRLEAVAGQGNMQDIFTAVSQFCRGIPFRDDCTVVEMKFSG